LEFGGYKVSRQHLADAKQTIATEQEDFEVTLAAYSNQLQSWTNAINLLTEHIALYGNTEDRKETIITRFCFERMEEAKQLIKEEDDELRFSVWLFDKIHEGLRLAYSDKIRDQKTLDHVFRPGDGLCGQCYIEGRTYNLPNAPKSAYYAQIRENPEYHGLLLVPMRNGTKNILGVLSIDRTKSKAFDGRAIDVAQALSDLLVYALAQTKS
jgi:transcriptional regulator with GAF, ATPase, and Fis domain